MGYIVHALEDPQNLVVYFDGVVRLGVCDVALVYWLHLVTAANAAPIVCLSVGTESDAESPCLHISLKSCAPKSASGSWTLDNIFQQIHPQKQRHGPVHQREVPATRSQVGGHTSSGSRVKKDCLSSVKVTNANKKKVSDRMFMMLKMSLEHVT